MAAMAPTRPLTDTTIVSARVQLPPPNLPSMVMRTEGVPPFSEIFRSVNPAPLSLVNAIVPPSGEKKGFAAPSVPGIPRVSKPSNARAKSFRLAPMTVAEYTTVLPSGEIANGAKVGPVIV